jgi:FkbM family methyltransferase
MARWRDVSKSARRQRRALGDRARFRAARALRFPYGTDWLLDVARARSWDGPTVLLDVGANVGDVTARLAKAFPDCTIWSFEPVSSTFATLERRAATWKTVQARRLALSDREGTATITVGAASHVNRLVPESEAGRADGSTETVTTTTVDAFLRAEGIERVGLLKIDTEGHDLRVLEGADTALRAGAVDLVLAECTWNPRERSPHVDGVDLVRHLRGAGFEVIASYSENVGNVIRGSAFANVLFARSRDR